MKTYGFEFETYKISSWAYDKGMPIEEISTSGTIVAFDSHDSLKKWLSFATWNDKAPTPHSTRIKVTVKSLKRLFPTMTFSQLKELMQKAYEKRTLKK